MNLTRTLSAVLALSLLTACDIASLMPDFNKKPGTLPSGDDNPAAPVELTAEEKAKLEGYTAGAQNASAQSMAAVTAINALKSVAAFGSSQSPYRTAALTFPEGVIWNENFSDDRFTGRYGTKSNEYHMDGTFTLKPGVTAEGQASLVSNQKPSLDTMDTFRATASVEVKMGVVPDSESAALRALSREIIKVDLKKDQPGISPILVGTYVFQDSNLMNGKGNLEVNILNNAWTVECKDALFGAWYRMNFEPNGAGQGTMYWGKTAGGVEGPDYHQKIGTISWGVDGKGKMSIGLGREIEFNPF